MSLNALEQRLKTICLYKDNKGELKTLEVSSAYHGTPEQVYQLLNLHSQRYAWEYSHGKWYRYVKRPKHKRVARYALKEKHVPEFLKLYMLLME